MVTFFLEIKQHKKIKIYGINGNNTLQSTKILKNEIETYTIFLCNKKQLFCVKRVSLIAILPEFVSYLAKCNFGETVLPCYRLFLFAHTEMPL